MISGLGLVVVLGIARHETVYLTIFFSILVVSLLVFLIFATVIVIDVLIDFLDDLGSLENLANLHVFDMNYKIIAERIESVLRKQTNWKNLWFYQKTVVLYQMTYVFTRRFLPAYGDRTVDQMIQAARSGKQNIVEGSADGVSSMELELKLLNVARASIQELLEDYEDFLISHKLVKWTKGHQRFDGMLSYCRSHNHLQDYEPFFERWTSEEMANTAITLCRIVDKMMMTYQKKKEEEFVKEGGIRERMTAARQGYRNGQKEALSSARQEIENLQKENVELMILVDQLKEDVAQLKRGNH